MRASSGISLAPQRARIAEAVGALVVGEDPCAQVVELGPREEARPDLRVRVHLLPLLRVERAGLREHAVRDADLPDVVQHAGQPNALDVLLVEPERARHQLGVAAHGVRVLPRAGVTDVERLGERDDGRELELAARVSHLRERARHLVAVDDGAVAAEVLRRGGRAVGGPQQLDGVLAVVRRRGHAEAEVHPGARVHEAPVDGPAQALGDDEGAALVRLGEEERELLAADAGGVVDAALPLERVLRDGLKGRVARRVALPLVDRPEAVDVADDH